uniref:Uncharacterized protein n=1 Tax=Desulfobacca acetoxidans TaxID=60893 RepID=A0A7C5EV77_9BACT
MALIHLPQSKWMGGTGRQVILKGDFEKIEQAMVESFELLRSPSLEYVSAQVVQVPATPDCKARVMLKGFPSPLHRGLFVDGGLSDGRYRENATTVTLDFTQSTQIWGNVKVNQWYCVYALAGASDSVFTLKAMPVMRVSTQAAQVITLRNNPNSGDIGYGFAPDELAGAALLVLTGPSRGLMRTISANNQDNGTGGTITYGGSPLTLNQGDWFVVLPRANFTYLGMVLKDDTGNLVPFCQEGGTFRYHTYRSLAQGAINGFTAFDLALVAPPTARLLSGYAAALNGYDLKLALSYDGNNPALIIHGSPPAIELYGLRGALPFSCLVPPGHRLYLDNNNTAHQVVRVTGWVE